MLFTIVPGYTHPKVIFNKPKMTIPNPLNLRDGTGMRFSIEALYIVKMKKYGLAVQDFTAALRLDPGFPDAYCNRGNAHQKLGENDLALQDYNAALKLQPNDGDLYYNRGVVLLSMGQQAKALEDLKRAAEMGEPNAKRYMKLAGAGTTNAQKSTSPKVEADIFKLIFKGDTAKVKQLLAANPELVHIKGKDGDTPLHQSAFWGRLEIAKELVNRGAQINQPGRLDNTPLHNAAFMGKTELVRLLLAQGADLKAKGNVGGTPLHSAAGGREDQRKLEIVRILIEEGADLDARDKMGGTPVHAAAFSDNPQIAELLIKSGAKVNLKDNSGKTPLAKAELFKRHKAAGILKKNGATL